MTKTIFEKIIDRELPSNIVYEDEKCIAIEDIAPKAPIHILIIPKEHISTLNDLEQDHKQTMGEIFLAAKEIAAEKGFAESGYRTVFNCNGHGQQTVFHIHLHLIGERQMAWPPG